MKIVGIDPGYAIVGYGVVDFTNNKFTTLDYGVVTTEAKTPFEDRLLKVYIEIREILKKYNPDALAIERLYFTSNQKTAIDVAQARGVIVLAARSLEIPVYEYTPLQVKQAVVGYGKALKKQVMEMTRILLKLEHIPKPDDAADALAIAVCHGHCARSLRFNLR